MYVVVSKQMLPLDVNKLIKDCLLDLIKVFLPAFTALENSNEPAAQTDSTPAVLVELQTQKLATAASGCSFWLQ